MQLLTSNFKIKMLETLWMVPKLHVGVVNFFRCSFFNFRPKWLWGCYILITNIWYIPWVFIYFCFWQANIFFKISRPVINLWTLNIFGILQNFGLYKIYNSYVIIRKRSKKLPWNFSNLSTQRVPTQGLMYLLSLN